MAFFQNIGPTEIILILLLAVLFFGAKKLPELARALGRSMKEFKKPRGRSLRSSRKPAKISKR